MHTVRAVVTAERQALELTKMEPLNDRILVKPIVEQSASIGGILLPSAPSKANSDAHFGTVVAIGADVKLELKEGDAVVFQKYAMAEVEVPEGEILFVAEKSVLGVLQQ